MKIKTVCLVAFSLFLIAANFTQQATTMSTPELYSAKTLKELRHILQAPHASDFTYRQTGYLDNNIGARFYT